MKHCAKNHLSKSVLAIVLLLTVVIACRKISIDKQGEDDNIKRARFFDGSKTANASIRSVINGLVLKDLQQPFAIQMAKSSGYPVWEKTIISNSKKAKSNAAFRSNGEGDTSYFYTPFVADEYQNVQAVLITRAIGDDTSYKFIRANDYVDWPVNANDDGGSATATDVAKLFLGFEKHIFDKADFIIKDRARLFVVFINVYVKSITVTIHANSIQVCKILWRDPDSLDDDPDHSNGNESYYDMQCETTYLGGGWGTGGDDNPPPPPPFDNGNGGGTIGGLDTSNDHDFVDNPHDDIEHFKDEKPVDNFHGWGTTLTPMYLELSSILSLNDNQAAWLQSHTAYANEVANLLSEEAYSEEAKIIAKIMIDEGVNNFLESEWDINFANVAGTHLQNYYASCCGTLLWIPTISFSRETTVNYAIARKEHPEWSKVRCLWEALKENIHTALDTAGLIPGVGEIADFANGVIYTIEGDGFNATLSFAATIPIAGWVTTTTKWAKKSIIALDGTRRTLKWVEQTNGIINFGDRGLLRKVLGLATGDARVAHHLIPWEHCGDELIQKAANYSSDAFSMNEILNGIPLSAIQHAGSHDVYNQKIKSKLVQIVQQAGGINNISSDFAAQKVRELAGIIKNWIANHPNETINNIVL